MRRGNTGSRDQRLALGAIMHQAEDQIWMSPSTSLWPTMGWQFPALDLQDYAGHILDELFRNPNAYVPEIVGLAIIAGFVWRFRLYRPETVKTLVRTGQLPQPQTVTAQVST